MFEADLDLVREAYAPAALVCSVLANIYRDTDKHPEPFKPADFMPGAKSEEDDWREFIEKVQSGHKFEVDPVEVANFRLQMNRAFKDVEAPMPQLFTNTVQ